MFPGTLKEHNEYELLGLLLSVLLLNNIPYCRFDYQDDQFQELLRMLDEILNLQTSMCCQVRQLSLAIFHKDIRLMSITG